MRPPRPIISAYIFLLSNLLGAQTFQSLSATADGSTLYFSSPVRPVGSTRTFHSKIYQWKSTTGVTVFAEVAAATLADGGTPTFYQLSAPQVSSDGTVFAYTGSHPDDRGRFAPPGETNQGIVMLPGRQ